MFTFEIIYAGKPKKVKGDQVGNYFAIDFRVGTGWVITHLPTGHTLIKCTFQEKDDAIYLADLAEKAYSNALAQVNERVLLDNRYINPDSELFYNLRGRLEDLDVPVTKEVIDEQITCISKQQRENISRETIVVECPA